MQVFTLDGTVVLADAKITIMTLGEDACGVFMNCNEYLVICKLYT